MNLLSRRDITYDLFNMYVEIDLILEFIMGRKKDRHVLKKMH